MVETWSQLQNHRQGRRKAAESVARIKKARTGQDSQPEDGAADSAASASSKSTYDDAVEALRKRYMNAGQDRWLTDHEAFAIELDGLFTKLKAHEAELAEVEARIAREKHKWYQATLRGSAAGSLAERSLGRPAYLRVLDALEDESGDWTAASDQVRKAIAANAGGDVDEAPSADDVLAKLDQLAAADDDAASSKRADLLVDLFFRDPRTGEVPASCAASAQALREGTPLSRVVGKLAEERSGAPGARSQADKHRRSLADLRRAQAAHEQDKNLKARNRQRKQAPRVQDALYESLPAGVDLADVRACALCQVFAGLGIGKGEGKIYASSENHEESHEKHVGEEHRCVSGKTCVQLTDEDVNMSGATEQGEEAEAAAAAPVVCRECATSLDRPTVYCSTRCATGDFQKHREEVHLPGRRSAGRDVNVDAKELVHWNVDDKSAYRAEDIERCVWRIEEALQRGFKEKNPDANILSVQ